MLAVSPSCFAFCGHHLQMIWGVFHFPRGSHDLRGFLPNASLPPRFLHAHHSLGAHGSMRTPYGIAQIHPYLRVHMGKKSHGVPHRELPPQQLMRHVRSHRV